ncbi:MAG: class B sortase [Oscillospiraceae bacterium]|jgi:sortase B|nr:class B sortase [Oscillospiraceae bacterium]
MTHRRKRGSVTVVWLILLLAICVTGFSAYNLREITRIYEEGDRSYEQLREQILRPDRESTSGGAAADTQPEDALNRPETEVQAQADIPALSVDFEALSEINTDSAAWLYCPDTVIDYPVMRADDYDRYLHLLPDGTYNANGSLFMDYNCPADFSGRLSVIYGHNMKSGKMFGSLAKYKQQSYFDEHPYMYLYTERENYRVELIYGCVIGANDWRKRAFMYEVNLEALLTYAAPKTTFDSAVKYTDEDRFLVLSTCSYEFDDARYIVIGVMIPEYGA